MLSVASLITELHSFQAHVSYEHSLSFAFSPYTTMWKRDATTTRMKAHFQPPQLFILESAVTASPASNCFSHAFTQLNASILYNHSFHSFFFSTRRLNVRKTLRVCVLLFLLLLLLLFLTVTTPLSIPSYNRQQTLAHMNTQLFLLLLLLLRRLTDSCFMLFVSRQKPVFLFCNQSFTVTRVNSVCSSTHLHTFHIFYSKFKRQTTNWFLYSCRSWFYPSCCWFIFYSHLQLVRQQTPTTVQL